MLVFEVALPLPLMQCFDYYFSKGEENVNYVGRRVTVEFGTRFLTGCIVSQRVETSFENLKPIGKILDKSPLYSEQMLSFTKWIAEYYYASWGETLKAAIPPYLNVNLEQKIVINPWITDRDIDKMRKTAPKRALILQLLLKQTTPVLPKTIEKRVKGTIPRAMWEQMLDLELIKYVSPQKIPTELKTIRVLKVENLLIDNNKAYKEVHAILNKGSRKQAKLLEFLVNNYPQNYTMAQIQEELNITNVVIKGLIEKGYISLIEIEKPKQVKDKKLLSHSDELNYKLTEEQENIVKEISNSIDNEVFETFLLYGITGSGKTLVYVEAIKKSIEYNKTSLLLVPEISLTPQLIDRFENFFPAQVIVLHSRMNDYERFENWKRIQNGDCKLVLGVRSAIFAPINNLGLIIVDEEHETSYKQLQPAPRYNARDAAVMLGKLANATVILGSATPSIESMYNAKKGKYKLLEIRNRADGAQLPVIFTVDTINTMKNGLMLDSFSKQLLDAIVERIDKNEGVILFHNRRGYSGVVYCSGCGHIDMCPNCDIPLTYHKYYEQLRCHYCAHTQNKSALCPQCGDGETKQLGAGTQRVEEELEDIFMDMSINAKIERFDYDTTSKVGAYRKILNDFIDGKIDVLVGTQMVAKGLDLHRVTLVGVINADQHLYFPDFRSSERTFQLLTQVAGRAGRKGNLKGEVIIQTAKPDNYAIKTALENDYDTFYETELNFRKNANYPPYSRFVLIEVSSIKDDLVKSHSVQLVKLLKENNFMRFQILGPTIPEIFKLNKSYRMFIIIKSPKKGDANGNHVRDLIKRTMEIYDKNYTHYQIRVKIDIDSYSGIY